MAFLKQLSVGPWMIFDACLLLTGTAMALEGFFWYLPGRHAGNEGLKFYVVRGQEVLYGNLRFAQSGGGPVRR